MNSRPSKTPTIVPKSVPAATELINIPQSPEAEIAVLGAIILDNKAIYIAQEIVYPDDFHNHAHKRIFATMLTMEREGVEIDSVSLYERLHKDNLIEAIGGPAYISGLADGLPRVTNVSYYSKVVKEKASLRSVQVFSSELLQKSSDPSASPSTVIQNAESQLRQLHEQGNAVSREAVPIKQAVTESYPVIEKVFNGSGMMLGEPTGYTSWDDQLAGWISGELVILAARPSMGKTALALELALRQLRKGTPVAIFSLETGRVSLVLRLTCLQSHINSHKLRSGHLNDADRKAFSKALGEVSQMPLWIDDRPVMWAEEFEWRLRAMGQRHKIRLAFLDYIQLLRANGQNRVGQVTEVSMRVKSAARALGEVSGGTLIALSQLSRIPKGERPRLDHLRESGQLEQDADVVLFINDGEVKSERESQSAPLPKELIVAKQKNGPVGIINMVFMPAYMGFEQPLPVSWADGD